MNSKFSRKIVFIVLLTLIASFFFLNSIDFVKGAETTITSTEDVIARFVDTKWGYNLIWSFSCENESIGVKAELIDEENFFKYNANLSYDAILLSDGTQYSDSGSYQTKYTSSYYVVFSINEIHNITEPVGFDYSASMWITLLFFVFGTPYVLLPLGIIILVITLVIIQSRKKAKRAIETPGDYQITISTNGTIVEIYCSQCGTKNYTTSNYCAKCGTRINK